MQLRHDYGSNKASNQQIDSDQICFTRFGKESVSNQTKVKASVQRGIVSKIISQFPALEVYIEDILPKKVGIVQVKWFVIYCALSSIPS
jgi:hypothetical protein